VIQTSSVRGFIPLYLLSGFKRWRRRTLRYQAEQQRIEGWLKQIEQAADAHPALALEIAQCQRLVKGYGDTHARGLRNYQTVMSALERNPSTLSPAILGALRDAALADEHGVKLEAALRQYALV
jgi:indolepyruvate ferredoxin oxidoreductase beta subunit